MKVGTYQWEWKKKERSGIACWKGSHYIEWKNKMCGWVCMAKTLQWECVGEIPITMSINTFKHIEIHWNILLMHWNIL
jgi:hypothetical protein